MTWIVTSTVVWLDSDDGVRLYGKADGRFHTLNPAASAIWRAAAAGKSLDEMLAALAAQFAAATDAHRRLIADDVDHFLGDMVAAGYLDAVVSDDRLVADR